jgi:hypothetical protein
LVEVVIFHNHDPRVSSVDELFGSGIRTEWIVQCTCGWYEKGYGVRDCDEKAMDHLVRVPDVTLALPLTPAGRRRWR